LPLEEACKMPDINVWRKYTKYAGILFVAAIIFYLGFKLYRSWNEIPFQQIQFNYYWAFISFLGLAASFVCTIIGWQRILSSLNQRISFKKSWWVVTGSYLAKYIPGHVWVIGGRMYLCKKEGISEKISGTGVILEMTAVLLAVLVVFIMSFPCLVSHGLPGWIWYLIIPVPFAAVLFFSPALPKILKWTADKVLKKELRLEMRKRDLLESLGLFILSSIFQGISFFLLIKSVFPLSFAYIPDIIGIFNGSWAIGFLSFIAPAGLGIREGVLSLFLSHYMPLPVAIIIAALTRLWMTVFEVTMALVGLKFMNRGKKRHEKE